MISPELQATSIADHCTRLGYTLVTTLTDLDLTGRFWKRRQVEQAVAMIEAGDADVLVVWKWSRVARNRRDWAVAVDRIETAGGRLESATEPVDAATSTGRLARGMLAEFAAFESERIGDTWRETHARRVSRGLPANGKPRWGYVYADAQHSPCPDTGPVLAALYRRYIAGESVYSLVRWLNAEGYRTLPGYSAVGPGEWTDRSLRRMLDTGFGAGLITVRGQQLAGAHGAVITAQEWARYLASRDTRRVTRSSERSQYLLSGLVRCACGSAMTGGQFGHARQPKFRCIRAKEAGAHDGGYVMMALVEREVLAWLHGVAQDVDAGASTAVAHQATVARKRRDAKSLAREVAKLDAQLANLTRQVAAGIVPESAYVTVRDEIAAERESFWTRLRQAELDADRGMPAAAAGTLLADWPTLDVAVRRGALKDLIGKVIVTPGRPRAGVEIIPTWVGD